MAAIFRSSLGRNLFLVHRVFISNSCYSYSSDVNSGGDKEQQDKFEESNATENSHQDDYSDHYAEYEEDYDTEETIKSKILDTAVIYVPEYGWCPQAIAAAAEAHGLSTAAEGMFPRGGGDLVLHFIETCNSRLAENLAVQSKIKDEADMPKVSTTKFISDAVKARLRMVTPHISTWPQAMSLMALPQNAPDAITTVAHMVDDMWYYAGDISTDMKWYTKRGILATLYGATELYLTQDKSSDFQNTWRFLDNRLNDINKMAKGASAFEQAACESGHLLSAIFTTARNMTGMNSRRNR